MDVKVNDLPAERVVIEVTIPVFIISLVIREHCTKDNRELPFPYERSDFE
jgi:hypothetical protein